MPASKIPQTANSVNSMDTASIADDVEDTDDFVIVSPGDYPETSAPSSTAAKDVWTEIIKITRTEDSLFEKGEKHVTAVETCRHHLRPSECRKTCNSTFKCDACLSLIAGLETLANCAWEWSNESKPFQDNISNIMHCLHRLPFHFQEGLYSVIEAVMDHEENWPTADRENCELWGFKISAALWLLRLGVHGLAWALEEGKEWRLVLAETERSWYEGLVVADEYEEAIEETKRFTKAFRKWGASVDAERRARSSA
ncbi:hypothetical protein J4E81_009690 [Alternaria sp. BMP 2799]|nr:hypothetical protein J4E81_009690 [Alternaria sp. BMP 2799]